MPTSPPDFVRQIERSATPLVSRRLELCKEKHANIRANFNRSAFHITSHSSTVKLCQARPKPRSRLARKIVDTNLPWDTPSASQACSTRPSTYTHEREGWGSLVVCRKPFGCESYKNNS